MRKIHYFIACVVVALVAGYVVWHAYHNPGTYDTAPLADTSEHLSRSDIKSETTSWPILSFNADARVSGSIDESAHALQGAIVPESMPVVPSKTLPSTSAQSPLSDAEYLSQAYPNYFINTLREWQTFVMNNSSLISTPHAFTSESDIFAFYETFLDFLASKDFMTTAEARHAKVLLRTDFKDSKDKERVFMSLIPAPRDNLAWLKRATAWLLPEKAFAIMWQSVPLCYKQSGIAVKGVVLPAPSCNSGATVKGAPVPDCGPQGAACVVPFGCLNAICRAHPNAIYDTSSKKCGCG